MSQMHSRRLGRQAYAAALTAAAALALAACGGGSGTGGGDGDKIGVSLITKTSTNPFFVTMQNGAKEAASKNNIKLTLAAGKADGDEATQVTAIENSIARGDKGILITVNGPGVNAALKKARDAGLLVIALDTPTDPASVTDATFATDNFEAGKLIGQWAAKKMNGKPAVIALIDAFSDKIITVDYNRDQGFLTGMGIPVNDPKKNGDEAKTGKYSGGDYTIACNQPGMGSEDGGRTAMENCLQKNPNINLVYTLNEPSGSGAYKALQAANTKATIVSVDGGCDPGMTLVKSGVIGATSQQYPLKMASLGVEAIAKFAKDKTKPANTSGKAFYDTGVSLVTDDAQDGVESIDSAKGLSECWGTKAS